jgi:hypothetical protein
VPFMVPIFSRIFPLFLEPSTLAEFVSQITCPGDSSCGLQVTFLAPTNEIPPVPCPNKVVGITPVPSVNSGRTLFRAPVLLSFLQIWVPILVASRRKGVGGSLVLGWPGSG